MKLTCSKCKNTYFKKIVVNEFENYNGTMYATLPEKNTDSDYKLYECIACRNIEVPTLSYTNSEDERKEAEKLKRIIEGTYVAEPENPLSRRVAPGTLRKVNADEKEEIENHGKFVRT
jgi:hypothetical protein